MKKSAVMVAFLLCITAVTVWGLASEPGSTPPAIPASTSDSDGDGLEEALELQIGTDPRLKDTDEDGLSDYDEYCKYCTDPAKADSDGDGVPDSDWNERREYTYTIRAVCEIRPPNQVDLMSDLYQDARRLDQPSHHQDSTVVEVLIFPLATPHVVPQPYPHLSFPEPIAVCTGRTLAFNYSPQMQQQVQAIVGDAKTDVAAVEEIVGWIERETRVVNTLPEFGYFHIKNGEIIWDRHLGSAEEEQRLLQSNFYGDSMFKARAHGTCSSIATLQVTMLRAAGLPARLIQTLPLINRYEADPEPLVDRMRRRIYAQGYEWGPGGGGANHMYTEVWLNSRWVRVDRSVGTGPMVGNKLFVKVFSAADWNNLYPARASSDWDNENRDFRTLDVADAEPRHASRFPPMFKLAVGKDALSVKRQADGRFQSVVAIHNAGTDRSPEFAVWFYAGEPAKGGRLLAQHAAGPIMPSDTWNEGTLPFELNAAEREVFVVIDPKGRLKMSGKTPIQVSQEVSAPEPRPASGSRSMFKLAVGKDALSVKRQADGRFQAWVVIQNEGTNRSPEFAVWFYAGDPAKGGRLLGKHAAGPIPPSEAWNEGTSPFELKEGEREVFVVLDPERRLLQSDQQQIRASRMIELNL